MGNQGQRIHWRQKDIYWTERGKGKSILAASSVAGFSRSTANQLEKETKAALPPEMAAKLRHTPQPLVKARLGPEAKRALEDFGYFQRRYFGRVPYAWQVQAAEKVVELLESDHKEYLVVNCPPGCGKSTLFTHDIPAWLTVRNRAIRGMIGSSTAALAAGYTDRLRKSFARTLPQKNDDDKIMAGLEFDAESTLAADFGRFQAVGDSWTLDSFVVQQYADQGSISEKESTWSAYGMDSGYIGQRFNFVIWDDLFDPKKQHTVEAKENLQDYWDDVSEPRLEPGACWSCRDNGSPPTTSTVTTWTRSWARTSTTTPGRCWASPPSTTTFSTRPTMRRSAWGRRPTSGGRPPTPKAA